MSGDTHAAFGAALSLGTATMMPSIIPGSGVESLVMGTLFAITGSLFADVDIKGSKANKALGLLGVVGGIFSITLLLASMSSKAIKSVFHALSPVTILFIIILLALASWGSTRPHREATHSVVYCIVTSVCVAFSFSFIYGIWFAIGYASHILIDLLNTKNENLAWPMGGKFCLGLCSASGIANRVLKYVFICISILMFCYCAVR